MKIAINRCYGGFCLSEEAYQFLGLEWDNYGFAFTFDDNKRTNPDLIKCIETLGERANGEFACLEVVEIPDDINWEIEDYDGMEWVSEEHRTWR